MQRGPRTSIVRSPHERPAWEIHSVHGLRRSFPGAIAVHAAAVEVFMCRVLKCKRAGGHSCFCQYVQEVMEVCREPSFSSRVSEHSWSHSQLKNSCDANLENVLSSGCVSILCKPKGRKISQPKGESFVRRRSYALGKSSWPRFSTRPVNHAADLVIFHLLRENDQSHCNE